MTWVNCSPQIHNTFGALWHQNEEKFSVNENCLEILEEILQELSSEDYTLRTFRRAIGFGQNIQKNLIPLLINLKNHEVVEDALKILDAVVKLLVNLTIPIEYLLPLEIQSQTDIGKHSIFELNNLLTTSKEAFADGKSTKAILDHVKYLIENSTPLTVEKCESINNCLLLLRNILHIPETHNTSNHLSLQNQIIWNLFTQSIDKILIFLISCPEKLYWSVTIVQLIALLYKDQHVGTLQKLLNLWLETSLSDSSEDNESNTSPPNQGSGDSSPFITSDPTSDSSDNGGMNETMNINNGETMKQALRTAQNRSKNLSDIKRVQSTETEASSSSGVSSLGSQTVKTQKLNQTIKMECPSSQSEISDCGYGTQVENQEFVSTSSNDDDQPSQKPVHQKPPIFQKTRYNKNKTVTALEKKELRRKKLVKRSKTNRIQMKGLVHHLPTDEDISNILKEFTVDFLLKGYGVLVKDLYSQLLSNIHIHIDTSHFFWLVTYFLKFASQLELDLEHIYPVLSYELISYLIFQGVWIFEELEILSKLGGVDIKPCLRRLHLVVTAIKEFLQAIEVYQKMIHLNKADRNYLETLQLQLAKTEDLGSLFILLLRHYNSKIQNKQYLQDLIVTNHNYLLFLENVSKTSDFPTKINVMEHLQKFATMEIMQQYGLLLENFKQNGEFINNCVFTMMHHMGGDLENVPTLYQPNILKTFSQIWETDYEICDDWADLIEYVIHKFINSPRPSGVTPALSEALDSITLTKDFNVRNKDIQNNVNNPTDIYDNITNLTQKYEQSGIKHKTQISIIKELLMQNIIKEEEMETILDQQKTFAEDNENKNEERKQIVLDSDSFDNVIDAVKTFLIKENKENYIIWLQNVLLEMCYAKLKLGHHEEFTANTNVVEPIIYYSSMLNLPVPLVPWTAEQNSILRYQPFILLLHKLGLYLPVDTGKVFVRIPSFWNADYIYGLAKQLGPIRSNTLKFNVSLLEKICRNQFQTSNNDQGSIYHNQNNILKNEFKLPSTVTQFTPLINPLSITIPEEIPCCTPTASESQVLDYSLYNASFLSDEEMEQNSICETTSVASDLTRMCVSDEEDKVIVLIDQKNI